MKARILTKALTTGAGVFLAAYLTPALAAAPNAPGRCRVLWSRHYADADYTSTAISKPVACLIAGTEAEPAQVELIPLEGTGEPDWVFTGTEFYVAGAREADVFAALDYDYTAQTVTIYKWHAASAVPDWSYTISSCTLALPDKALVVSADGSTLCVLVEKEPDPDPIYSRMYCFDADSGSVLCTHNSPDVFMPLRVAVSRYGDYIAYTAIDIESAIPSGRIFTITRDSCNNYWTGIVLLFGSGLCVSPDGEYLAHDVFTFTPLGFELVIRKWRDFLPGYYVECSHDQADYVPVAFACSWDFSTLISGWDSMEDPPQPSKVKLFEMADCDEEFPPVWTYNYPSDRDFPVDVALTTDGARAVVGNWTDPDTNPEILVFEHASSQPIGTVDTPDDVVDVDIGLATCGGAYVAAVDGDLHVARVYEGVITVCPDHSGDYITIQDAVDAASDGCLVELCDDTFAGLENRNIDFGGKKIAVGSESGDPAACVIDCESAGHGFYFHSDETECSRVENITIINGEGSNYGGGIYCYYASPTVAGCIISGNSAFYGGGISCQNSSPTIAGCVITGNRAYKGDGGGVCCTNSEATLMNCTISGNSARDYGGGIYSSAHPYLENTILWGNCAGTGVGDEWYWSGHKDAACCDINEDGVDGWGMVHHYLDKPNIDEHPLFCDPGPCQNAPTAAGDYHLFWLSPSRAEANPECGLIGALDIGCYEPCPNSGGSGRYCSADIYPNNDDSVWSYYTEGDCIVGLSDLAQLLGNYGMTAGATREHGDIDPWPVGDGDVDLGDLAELLSQYGDNCN